MPLACSQGIAVQGGSAMHFRTDAPEPPHLDSTGDGPVLLGNALDQVLGIARNAGKTS